MIEKISKHVDLYITGLLIAISLGLTIPVGGPGAHVVDIIVNVMIVLLFFFQGARLSREAVVAALKHWRLHGTIFATTFLVYPLIGIALHAATPNLFAPVVWTGVLFLCALPSTVQSSVAFTSIAKGNVAAAITSAAGSNIIGVALTPALLAIMLTAQKAPVAIDFSSIGKLVLLLLLPFALGQIFAKRLTGFVQRHRKLLILNDRGVVLLAVYGAFSAATREGLWQRLPMIQLGGIAILCVVMLAFVLWLTWSGGRMLGFSREDSIALLMCGSKKSLASGVPIASVLFQGPLVGVIVLPIMLYHQIQLVVCAFIARRLGSGHEGEGW